MNKEYFVKQTNKQSQHLEKLISSGIAPAKIITRAHILLKSDCGPDGPNWTYAQHSEAFNVTDETISKIHKRFVESGFEAALYRKKPDREYKRAGVANLFMVNEPLSSKRQFEFMDNALVRTGHT